MRISLIIPTLNAVLNIERLLVSLWGQDVKPEEIIIIDSSSEDKTVETAERLGAKAIIIPRRDFNHGRTRNIAAMESKGDTLMFMTQDAMPYNKEFVRKLIVPLEVPDIAAAFGRQMPGPDASPLDAFLRKFNYPEESMVKGLDDIGQYGIKTFFFSNVCSAIKKDLFIKAGMFPEVRANEDMLIASKLILNNYRIAYVHDAMVIHSHDYSLPEQFIRYYSIGSSLRRNKWILKYAQAEGEGMRFIREQIGFVVKSRKYIWMPYMFLEYLIKYAGYRIGLIAG